MMELELVKILCADCQTPVELKYHKISKRFEAVCSNCSVHNYAEVKMPWQQSLDVLVKTCEYCDTKWVRRHNCFKYEAKL